jgi:hypothetical protein
MREIPGEEVVATFLKRSIFSSMEVIIFDEEVRVTDGIFC